MHKLLFIGLFLLSINTFGQDSTDSLSSQKLVVPDSIQWLSFDEAITLNKLEKRKILIFVYTEGSPVSKRMESTTFQDTIVKILLTENYYAVKLNAESTDTIHYKGSMFSNVYFSDFEKNYHELALGLSEYDPTFPALVFLGEDEMRLNTIKGYKNADYLNSLLGYYMDNMHLQQQKTGFGQNFRYNCQNPNHPHNRLNQAIKTPDVSIPEK